MTQMAESTNELFSSSAMLRAFLIADVRGYTKFTNEQGDEAAARLAARFADVVEEEVGPFEGEVLELRGDEALVVFTSARQALRAAVSLQDRFSREVEADPSLPLRVGMGLDAGEAIPVKGGYRGGPLNLAARLCSIAAPGEVFASEGLVHLARRMEGYEYKERGEVQLKGLPHPVKVIQVVPEGADLSNAPTFTVHVTPAVNLPVQPTPFIGREQELRGISGMLLRDDVRLLTLTGPGGTGKTRLALQAAHDAATSFPDGVFFVSLAPLANPDLVPVTVAETLGVKEQPDRQLMESVQDAVGEKHLLLVLDNFEHLLDACSVVCELLTGCCRLKILVTSRASLNLLEEHLYAVPPLAVPDPKHLPDLAALSQYDAVALFIQRAGAARAGFQITNENAPAVAEICSRLDGLPLAIELAAARVKLFPPQALLQRLSRRLTLLTGGARNAPSRQQTLRGAIDWSYSLLEEGEQTLFARLSVFAGGCTLEAAEAVCNGERDLPIDVLDGIASLVEKSLLRQEGEEELRFHMLETIREYAVEKLDASGEGDRLRELHAATYLQIAGKPEDETRRDWYARIGPEVDNLRDAFRTALRMDPAGALGLAVDLLPYWESQGIYSEGIAWYEESLAHGAAAPSTQRARALSLLAYLHRLLGQIEPSRSRAEEALGVARESGDPATIAHALEIFASSALFHGDVEAGTRALEEALPLARGSGEAEVLAGLLKLTGTLAVGRGDLEIAHAALDEAWAIERSSGEFSDGLYFLAGLAVLRGDADEARARAEEGLSLLPGEGGHRFIRAHLEETLARALVLTGDLSSARSLLRSAATTHLETGAGICRAHALEGFARVALAQGETESAVRMLGAARRVCSSLGMTLLPIEQLVIEQTIEAARHAMDEAGFVRAWEEGESISPEETMPYVLGLESQCEGTAGESAPSALRT